MYLDYKRIENVLNCKKCKRTFKEPRILNCGESICSLCASSISVDSNNHYDCLLCSKKHKMPKDGLIINKNLLELLSIEPCEVSRGDAAESLNNSLKIIQTKIKKLTSSIIKNSVDIVKESCINLKADVKLATENTVKHIYDFREKMIAQIDDYLNVYINEQNKENLEKSEFMKTANEMTLFHSKWSDYLKLIKISDQPLIDANKLAI